jgi:hypothetical protein
MNEPLEPKVPVDAVRGFIAAVLAPALLAGLFGLAAGPLVLIILIYALVIAALHVALLAVPLYALLRLWREPGPAMVLISSLLIGTLPLPLLLGGPISLDLWPLGLCGLCGGGAFLLFSRNAPGEGS